MASDEGDVSSLSTDVGQEAQRETPATAVLLPCNRIPSKRQTDGGAAEGVAPSPLPSPQAPQGPAASLGPVADDDDDEDDVIWVTQ